MGGGRPSLRRSRARHVPHEPGGLGQRAVGGREQAGLDGTRASTLTVRVRHASFEEWWEPLTLGVGPAGSYVASLPDGRRAALREQCRRLLPAGPVEISATAWAAAGRTGQ